MSEALEEIAVAAARLVVEEGMEYGAAKRKAARELGRRSTRRLELPDNEQVEDEVRTHIAIFHPDTQAAELLELRSVALRWMQRLAEYRPHLAGAAWRGTATRRSAVFVDLYCDDPKAAELALVNAGVDYDVGAIERPRGEPVNVLTVGSRSAVLNDIVTVHLALHDLDDQRGALKPDARGRSWRGDLAALQRLMVAGPDEHTDKNADKYTNERTPR
jgi:hypothetical protein